MRAPRPLWGVLCRCVAPHTLAAVLVCAPLHGRPCCFAALPPSWWGVLCRCVAPLMVGHAVLVPVRRGGCAWCGGAGLGLSSCVLPGGRRWVRVGGVCGGVLAYAMCGLFCLFGVVFAAMQSACLEGCGRRLDCGCGCVDHLAGPGAVLLRGPPHGWAYAVLVRAPPHGGACCVGVWPLPWWGVLRWFVVPLLVGRAVLVRAPFMVGRAVSVCAPPPPTVGRAALVCGPPPGGACCVGAWPPSR